MAQKQPVDVQPFEPLSILPAPAIVQAFGYKVLKGLSKVSVAIKELGPNARGSGLWDATIAAAVEVRLRAAGITVLGMKDGYLLVPTLWVNVGCMKADEATIVYNVSVCLIEAVRLERSLSTTVLGATIWSKESNFGMAGKQKIEDAVMSIIKNNLDEFVNDFLKANPKKAN